MSRVLTKTHEKRLLKQLQSARKDADVEKAVENAVINMLRDYLEGHGKYASVDVSYPFNTDGIVHANGGLFFDDLIVLLEAKRDKNFAENKTDVHAVLAQSISYLRTIKNNDPHMLPNIVVIADNNEIFMVPTGALQSYLDKDYDWTLSPSSMHKDTLLMSDLDKDKNIRPVIYDINEKFNVVDFCDTLVHLAEEAEYVKIKIGKSSLSEAFDNFRNLVYGTNDPGVIQDENRAQIELFSRTLFGDENVFAHPKKSNVMFIDGEEVEGINTQGYEIFSTRYDANGYSYDEYKTIMEMSDTLIEESNRRFKGDYYTPVVWVNKAHRTIADALGSDWKDKYVVWDSAAGTKNLTRDYKFADLYSSTLFESELLATQKFNKDNVAFQYDFLNDDMELHDGSLSRDDLVDMSDEEIEETLKMPVSLVRDLLEKKPVVFFTNPPYGQATSALGKDHKPGVSATQVTDLMEGLGWAKKELYTQFIWRTKELAKFFEYTSDFHFFFFFNKTFLTSPNFVNFTKELTSEFTFRDGFMINAGEFSGTSSAWGIVFSHFEIGGTNQREFEYEVLASNKDTSIKHVTTWVGRSVDKRETLDSWFKEIDLPAGIDENAPFTKNGFEQPTSRGGYASLRKGWIGHGLVYSSSVQKSDKYLTITSLGYDSTGTWTITRDNFARAVVTFSIRRSVQEQIARNKQLWIRDKDIFTRPSEELLTDEFIADCVVYSLFDRQSNQTSLRNYNYNGKTYRVENEFFPFSTQFVKDLAITHGNLDIQADLQGDSERFVYTWLEAHKDDLSDEAQALLDAVKELYEESFSIRDEYARTTPRYNTNSWDAGFAQIARMCFGNDRHNDDFLHMKDSVYALRSALGEKIAHAAMEDGVI